MEEEKKQNQKNQVLENSEKVKVEKKHKKKRKHTEEKEKNVDSMKLSKSFVILEEKKKLLSEKKGKYVMTYIKVIHIQMVYKKLHT